MSDEPENPKRSSSAGTWIATIAIVIVIYVISPPFVIKLIQTTTGSSVIRNGSGLERAFNIFYWPLFQLEELGLHGPMEKLYDWVARLFGLR